MSYTELESGYQDLKQANRPGFFVGHDGNGDIDSYSENNDGIDSDCSASSNSGKQINVGICAMAKKTQSKPMKEILTRLQEFEYIKIFVFPEDVILKEPVENWPICDCLISFHSKGFPLDKAIQYAQLRKPYVINNLHMQYDIQDRRRVYAILESEGIEIPRYAVLDRDSPDPKKHELVESEDHVEVNGIIFNKPFVEKPVSAEDHNIYIYYPTSAGGGSQRLFRKIGSRSSVYSPESRVRKTGSFIYEDFMPTDGLDIKVYTVGPDYAHAEARKCPIKAGLIERTSNGTDVKVYTVGPDYAHAEARKSPALDGKVERDSEGKEIRYPVILNNAEKLISRKVCLAFKQTVCGFDLLRANGKSYVCDVNGFSFVKNSNKYYDDCAKILGNMILRELTPTLHIPWSVPFQLDDPPIVPTTFGKMMELRCVVAVIRHGDRTPKQKMKVEVRHPKFFEIFEKYDGYKHGHVKLKRPKQLQEILDIARSLLTEIQTKAADCEIEEKQGKLEQLKAVLEMYGHFSGINRKVQMKYQPKGRPRGSSSDDGNSSSGNTPKEPSLVLILKWGGELTPAGRIQAEELGRIFRCMYPGGQGRHDYSGAQGLGLLRLHSTFRHDLKIYASDEGRVQMTAAAFAKGLLALEGELTPILVQMVKSANTNGLLDNDCDSSKYQNMAKNRLHELMQIDREFTKEDRDAINPGNSISINQAMDFVKNPVKCCAHVHSLIKSLLAVINVKKDDPKTKDAILYHGETWDLMGRRWEKIEKDFSTKSKAFDISKIPDIYDCIKYDLQHNQHTLQYEQAEELYIYAKYLADIVIPQEYGLTVQEKLTIGQGICTPLLKKIKADLQRNIEEAGDESVNRLNPRYSHGVSSPGRHVRTRLYFTSESHVHSLLTVLRYGGLLNILTDEQWRRAMEYISMVSELNYMSQIVIMLYEDPTKDPFSEERFHVELHFSPGVNCCVQKNLPPGPGFRPHSRNDSGQSKKTILEDNTNPTRIDEENDVNLEESPLQNSKNSSENPSSPEENSEIASLPQTEYRRNRIKQSMPIPITSHHHTVCGHEARDLAKRLSEELAAQQHSNNNHRHHHHHHHSHHSSNKASVGSLDTNRPISPDPPEPRSRSYEQKDKDINNSNILNTSLELPIQSSQQPLTIFYGGTARYYKIDSSTNELPLSEIDLSMNPLSPESLHTVDPLEDSAISKVSTSITTKLPSIIPSNKMQLYEDELFLRQQQQQQRNLLTACITPSSTNERPLSCTCLASLSNEDDVDTVINFHSLSPRRPSLLIPHITLSPPLNITDRSASADNLHNFTQKYANENFIDSYHLSCSAPAALNLHFTSTTQQQRSCSKSILPDKTFEQKNDTTNENIIVNPKKHSIACAYEKTLNPMPPIHRCHSDTFDLTSLIPVIFAPPPIQAISHNLNPTNNNVSTSNTNNNRNYYNNNNNNNINKNNDNNDSFNNDCNNNFNSPTFVTQSFSSLSSQSTPKSSSCYHHQFSRSNVSTTTNQNIPNVVIASTKKIDIIHNNTDTPDATVQTSSGLVSSTTGTTRRQRHSIAGQMNYFKMLGFGGFGKKVATSANSLFSTAVISGSSSAPNLREMIPNTATPSVLEGFGGVPPIRPLETLHNALSLKQLDGFLEKMTSAPLFKTPASSPPKQPSTPVPSASNTEEIHEAENINSSSITEKLNQQQPQLDHINSWTGQSSMNSSIGTLSGTEPSSPIISEDNSHECPSSDISSSLIVNIGDGSSLLQKVDDISHFFPKLDDDLNAISSQFNAINLTEECEEDVFINNEKDSTSTSCTTPISMCSEINSAGATKGSTTMTESLNDEDDESTISVETLSTTAGDVDEMKTKSHDSLPPILTIPEEKLTTFPRIKKQISLFESTLSRESSIDRGELLKPASSSGSIKLNELRNKFQTIDTLQLVQSTSNDNFLLRKSPTPSCISDTSTIQSSKTKSCMNLKSCNSPTPGALVVKEIFIEPPKRVAKSFHGHTDHRRTVSTGGANEESSSNRVELLENSNKNSLSMTLTLQKFGNGMTKTNVTGAQKPRFITTKVEEDNNNAKFNK